LERYTDGEESPGGQLAREIIKRGDIVAQNQMRAPQVASSPLNSYAKAEAHHLAKQLRDLIAHLDIVSEEHRHKISEFDEVYDGLVSENDQLQNQIRALNQRIKQLEETDQLRNETLTMLKESERTRMEDLKQLKRENALLTRKQRSKESDDSTMVQICKEQMEELKKSKRDLERQRIDQRAQIRKLETTIKEKDKRIDEIAAEKERLERRFKAVSSEQAKVRGRRAEETLYQEAVERASNKAPVTMAAKRIGGMTYNYSSNPKENLIAKNGSDTRGIRRSDERTESSASERREEALLLDSTPRSQSPVNGVVPVSGMGVGKSVRWNEPLTTELFFSPPSERQETERSSNESSVNVHQGSVEPNADMQLVRVEDNIIGRASLFQSVADFTVYTRTHCGCNYYEYSNTDTRWVHPSHKYQVNYYGQMGATTVQIESGVLLVRHFLNGQLEIYRQSGEITLVTSSGRRIEIIKDENGLKRIEMFGSVRFLRLFLLICSYWWFVDRRQILMCS
uniref:Spindle assembly abnormal protein 4 (inferred by orthology to a C. elegans protein) n=1 Tax=Anisakis simplex TaxID=6269 RepID=A0A0M3J596_ANISI